MKNIFVTGAGSAIAYEACKIWANRKYHFFLVDKDEYKVKAVADDLKVRGASDVRYTVVDLAKEGAGALVVKEATKVLGSVDLVLVAHGYLGLHEKAEENINHANKILSTNLTSAVEVLTELTRNGAQKKMTIGVISSVAGDRGREGNYIYGAAKGGLAVFADGMRSRFSNSGIHITTIKPGFVDTPMTKNVKKGLLWVKPDVVAKDIVIALDKKKNVVYTPWFWRYIMWVIKIIPETVFKKLSI